jgi:hypothetical protein
MTGDELIVREIIDRYGEMIDIRANPHLIIEIIGQYAGRLGGGTIADCQPPGGPPDVGDGVNVE